MCITSANPRPDSVIVGVEIDAGHIDRRTAKKCLIDISNAIDARIDHQSVIAFPGRAIICGEAQSSHQTVTVMQADTTTPYIADMHPQQWTTTSTVPEAEFPVALHRNKLPGFNAEP